MAKITKLKVTTNKKFKKSSTSKVTKFKTDGKKLESYVNDIPNKMGKNRSKNVTKSKLTHSMESDLEETILHEDTKSEIVGKFVMPLPKVDFDIITKAVVAVLKIHEDRTKTSNVLFEDEQPIFLQIAAVKVPKCPFRIMRLQLPHTLMTETSDVCLFVCDLKKGRRIDHEQTVHHYEDYLKANEVKNIKSIIPIRQIKVEFDQFELKNRLLRTYDYFLVDSKISGHVFHLLGKKFQKKRKNPTPVRMNAKDLKSEINRALCKVPLYIHSHGDSHIVQVGHTHQKINNIAENIYAAVQELANIYPGGWDNIRSLFIKTLRVAAIPIYMSLKSNKSVKAPVMKSKRPANYKKVRGELTTSLNNDVVLHPSGNIKIIKKKNKKNDLADNIRNNVKQKVNVNKTLNVELKNKESVKNRNEIRDEEFDMVHSYQESAVNSKKSDVISDDKLKISTQLKNRKRKNFDKIIVDKYNKNKQPSSESSDDECVINVEKEYLNHLEQEIDIQKKNVKNTSDSVVAKSDSKNKSTRKFKQTKKQK